MARKYPATFTEGDRIAYSVQFLRSILGEHRHDLALGKVIVLTR